jgi:hypothetical protein
MLAACSGRSGPDNASHDTKYRTTEDGCVEDTVTGLLWEAKSDLPGLRDWRNTYTWYSPNDANDELDYRGTGDGGECADSACDTWEYVIAINASRLCGHSDWRMPLRDELFSISDLRKAETPPTANMEFFPHMQAAEYWSSNDYSFQHDAAWGWSYQFGHDRVDWKRTPKFVRLVRGDASNLTEVKE